MNPVNLRLLQRSSLGVVMALALAFAPQAFAMTPSLSASLGSGDSVIVTVNGDANSSVVLHYLTGAGIVQLSAIGSTNSSGYFSGTIGTAAYNVSPGSLFNVQVNGQQSQTISWPYTATSTGSASTLSLSQTSATLSLNQSVTITAYNNNTSALFVSSNTSPSVANISVNGNQFTISAISSGSTTINVCSVANTANCASIVVTVQGSNVNPLTFSQSNVTVAYGQTASVTVAGGNGTYSITSNSNSAAIQAAINGSTVNLYANSATGSATITVCSTDMGSCGIINVTAGSSSSASLTFSQTNPSLITSQTVAINVSGGSGTYYLSSNSNTSVIQANLVGGVLTLFGGSSGSAVITVCASGGGCGSVTATVSLPGSSTISLGQNNLTLGPGQISNIPITGAGGYTVSTNSSPSVASAMISGSNLMITGVTVGSTTITVCQTGGQCAVLYITVNGTAVGTTNAPTPTYLVSKGQTLAFTLSGGIAPYYLSSNTNGIVNASLSGNTLTVYAASAGNTTVTACSTGGGCAVLPINVSGSSYTAPSTTNPSTSSGSSYKFNNPLKLGDEGTEVTELQKRLTSEGVYSGPITGYYGSLTVSAVKAYQVLHNLSPLGNVGPGTRSALNGS